ncbi:MAG: hypothetical protein KDA22_01120 [Phycisphaerales bacterium]|nr:hypothetical protein [Phycisphaerales bacterium]
MERTSRAVSGSMLGTVLARVIAPAALFAIAAYQWRIGSTDALPVWIANLARNRGADPVVLLRILLALELGLATIILLVGRWARPLATVALAAVTFSAVASASALLGDWPRLVWPLVTALVAGGLLALVRLVPARVPPAVSGAWRVIVAVVAMVGGIGVASRVPLVRSSAPPRVARTPSVPSGAVELDVESWIGQPVSATAVKTHLPALTALTLEGRSLVVFYNPRCGRCHELFEDLAARGAFDDAVPGSDGVRVDRVIAVEVPNAEGAFEAAGDELSDIVCPGCPRLVLPKGPIWMITPPIAVVVQDGVVTCVAKGEVDDCLAALAGS